MLLPAKGALKVGSLHHDRVGPVVAPLARELRVHEEAPLGPAQALGIVVVFHEAERRAAHRPVAHRQVKVVGHVAHGGHRLRAMRPLRKALADLRFHLRQRLVYRERFVGNVGSLKFADWHGKSILV